ncbi:hexamerin-like, partial [Chironomus tepperi]|uniref:hexamerin-like n=1 Tax=Chironomus tepperi TaxID=113505 RepID=UPI00391FA8D8
LYYKHEEENFSEVKIDKVEVDKLVTYFDNFDADITNALERVSHYQGEDFIIKARTTRLNTLPFTYKLHFTVDTSVKGVVRCYIGPKYDEYGNAFHVNDNKENFVHLDVFPYELNAGKHIVTWNSNDLSFLVMG